MAVTTTKTNKPINPRGNDQSPKGYNRAELYTGKALDFDGVNDSVNLDGFTMTGTTATFAFNVNFDAITINQFVFDLKPVRFVIGLSDITGNPFGLYDNSQWQSFGDLEPNQWHNVSISIDGTSAKMYLNGQSFGNETTMANAIDFDSATEVAVGSNFSGGGGLLNGQIAGFKIFNTALTAAQVADLYNNPEKVVPTGVDNTALKLWLPMMEGAGTTAYDGSGNGNHGTISGATYVNGVGAPVAQSAVMDWNKGVNLTNYSEDGAQWSTVNTITITQDQSDPFGGTRAQRFTMDAGGTYSQAYKEHSLITGSTQYTAKMWLKAVSGTPTIGINYNQGTWHQVTLTNEWAEYEVTRTMGSDYSFSHNIMIGTPSPGTSSTADFYIYGLQIQLGDTAGPYVPTFGTAQPSPVLLPQGLTSGRDITGVNLFENVRKQGALNLDGNSWAEVHDNASIDLTTSATLECWYKWGSRVNAGLVGRWDYPNNQRSLLLLHGALDNARLLFSFDGTNASAVEGTSTPAEGTWVHIAGTYDGTTFRLYVNATQEATASSTGVLYNSPDPLEIGRHGYGALDEINGSVAQPRIYNRALTAEEVERNYNAGKNIYK